MPKTITKAVTLYTFKELVELEKAGTMKKTCQRAREWLQEGATDHDWWDCTYEQWTSAMEQIGFDSPGIQFSGFWSQGDGASFTCKSVDMDKLIDFMSQPFEPSTTISYDGEKEDFRGWITSKCEGVSFNPLYRSLTGKVCGSVDRHSSHYSHEHTCDFSIECEDDSEFFESAENTKLANDLGVACERLRLYICRAIYKDLEEEYNWRNADEQLIEDAEANEWTFNSQGKMETE